MAMCKCGKCAECKKRGKYIGSAADKKQDAKTMKGMTPAQKAKFQKEDAKMDKNKGMTKSQDTKKDNALAKKIKSGKK
jgi:hypothetical protein